MPSFERFTVCSGLGPEIASFVLPAYLDDLADSWYNNLTDENIKNDYGLLRCAFLDRFHNEVNTFEDALKEFIEIQQKGIPQDVDWDDLVLKHNRICDRLGFKKDFQEVVSFKSILPPGVQPFLRLRDNPDLTECARHAKILIESEWYANNCVPRINHIQAQDVHVSQLCPEQRYIHADNCQFNHGHSDQFNQNNNNQFNQGINSQFNHGHNGQFNQGNNGQFNHGYNSQFYHGFNSHFSHGNNDQFYYPYNNRFNHGNRKQYRHRNSGQFNHGNHDQVYRDNNSRTTKQYQQRPVVKSKACQTDLENGVKGVSNSSVQIEKQNTGQNSVQTQTVPNVKNKDKASKGKSNKT